MIRDDKQRVIGKLISINSERFTVELLNRSINFTTNGFDDIYQYAQLNGYVVLPYQDYYIISEIFGVREKDADIKWKNEKEQILGKSSSVQFIDINPIGTIKRNKDGKKTFKYGVSVFPTLYSDVLYLKQDELDAIFEIDNSPLSITSGSTALRTLELGTSTIFPDYKVSVDINGFFGHHAAILGNTGSGKSCTISSMLQTLFSKDTFSATGASFVFLDVNGEYHKAFCQFENSEIETKHFSIDSPLSIKELVESYKENDPNFDSSCKTEFGQFFLPHWFLNIEEWALLLQASEKTQLPILRNALGFSQDIDEKARRHIYASAILYVYDNWESPVAKRQKVQSLIERGKFTDIDISKYDARFGNMANDNERRFRESVIKHIDQDNFTPPQYRNERFEFSNLGEFLEDAILYEEYHGNKQIRDYCASLITRFKSLNERKEYEFLKKAKEQDLESFFEEIVGGKDSRTKKTQISILDLNCVDDEIVEVISCVLARIVFNRLKNIEPRNRFPVNLVLEEAHRYISCEATRSFSAANKVFERIAKEGRKYGMFLLISSQRPSELSKTVLSQCSNFIVHRIQNPDDLAQIRQMTPHISSSILGRLPSIPRQHALVFGHSVQIPTLFKVNDARPTPHSHDNDVVRNWFLPKYIPQDPPSDDNDSGPDTDPKPPIGPKPLAVLHSEPILKTEVYNQVPSEYDDDLPF